MIRDPKASALSLAQGVYFLSTGLWPLVDDRSFQRVTGPKPELWLVKTVGVLVSLIGGTLIVSGAKQAVTAETALLGASTAAGLAGIDITYTAKGRISPVYLLDAVLEAALVFGWIAVSGGARTRRAPTSSTTEEQDKNASHYSSQACH
jgi:ABC-type cobalamin transport system permease subunit